MLCAGGYQIDPGGLDAAVPEQVGKLDNIMADLIENSGKQVPQIVREHLARLYARIFAELLELCPDLAAVKLLSASGAKNRAGGDFLFLSIAKQIAAEPFRQQNHADFPFEGNFRLALPRGFHGDIAGTR